MNRVVVVGAIIAIVLAVSVVGILAVNHQNSNYAPTTTTTNNGPNVTPNANTTTSTTTSTMPTTSTTTTTTNIPYNTFYLLNESDPYNYYIFVLSYNDYKRMMGDIPNAKIISLKLMDREVDITKIVVTGNYAYIIGYTSPLNLTIGQPCTIEILTNFAGAYWYSLTYEGNWTGPVP
jgi:hypothetical protein